LLGEPFVEPTLQLFEIERLDESALFFGERRAVGRVLEPAEQLVGDRLGVGVHPAKVRCEGDVERVEVRFAMDEDGASEKIETVERAVVEPERKSPREGDRLLHARGHPVLA